MRVSKLTAPSASSPQASCGAPVRAQTRRSKHCPTRTCENSSNAPAQTRRSAHDRQPWCGPSPPWHPWRRAHPGTPQTRSPWSPCTTMARFRMSLQTVQPVTPTHHVLRVVIAGNVHVADLAELAKEVTQLVFAAQRNGAWNKSKSSAFPGGRHSECTSNHMQHYTVRVVRVRYTTSKRPHGRNRTEKKMPRTESCS